MIEHVLDAERSVASGTVSVECGRERLAVLRIGHGSARQRNLIFGYDCERIRDHEVERLDELAEGRLAVLFDQLCLFCRRLAVGQDAECGDGAEFRRAAAGLDQRQGIRQLGAVAVALATEARRRRAGLHCHARAAHGIGDDGGLCEGRRRPQQCGRCGERGDRTDTNHKNPRVLSRERARGTPETTSARTAWIGAAGYCTTVMTLASSDPSGCPSPPTLTR